MGGPQEPGRGSPAHRPPPAPVHPPADRPRPPLPSSAVTGDHGLASARAGAAVSPGCREAPPAQPDELGAGGGRAPRLRPRGPAWPHAAALCLGFPSAQGGGLGAAGAAMRRRCYSAHTRSRAHPLPVPPRRPGHRSYCLRLNLAACRLPHFNCHICGDVGDRPPRASPSTHAGRRAFPSPVPSTIPLRAVESWSRGGSDRAAVPSVAPRLYRKRPHGWPGSGA